MNTSVINELFHQIDEVTSNTYSKLKSGLSKKSAKQTISPLPLNTILSYALELIYIILLVSSILGIYFASGLHEWWTQLVGHIYKV